MHTVTLSVLLHTLATHIHRHCDQHCETRGTATTIMSNNRRGIPTLWRAAHQASLRLLGIITVYTSVFKVFRTHPNAGNSYSLFSTTDKDKVHIKYLTMASVIKLLIFAHSVKLH